MDHRKPYSTPTFHPIGQEEVTRKSVAELQRLALPLGARIVLFEHNVQIQVPGHLTPNPEAMRKLAECLGPSVVITQAKNPNANDPDPLERMSQLAESFPILKSGRVHGVRPWDAKLLETASGLSHGEHCAVQFLLSVWNPGTSDWKCGPFVFQEALGVWGEEYRRAFLAWASSPWWP